MTDAQLTFVETFAAMLIACALALWLGYVMRDKEVERLEQSLEKAAMWEQHCETWIRRATDAETRLPRRGPHGQFAKRT